MAYSITEGISSTPGIKEVGITTNGLVLQRFLPQLRDAGLTKVNMFFNQNWEIIETFVLFVFMFA